jgi:HSP20 family protein
MSLVRFRPAAHFPTAIEQMNRLFDDFLARPLGWDGLELRGPAVDVYETDGDVMVKAELPGVKKEDVHVSIEGETLTLKGESRHTEEARDDGYYRREMRYGSFHRTIPLPVPVKQDEISARFEDGILTIRCPKSVEATIGRTIPIE